MAARNVHTFRFDDETANMLKELSQIMHLSPAGFLAVKIRQEYDAIKGNPRVLEAIAMLDEMAELAERMGSIVSAKPNGK